MSRHLAPALLLLLVVLGIGLRTAQRPSEALSEDRIRAYVEGEDPDRLMPALDRYLASFENPRNLWFAAGVLMRLKQYERAVDTIFESPELAADLSTARRFAREALYGLGWEDEERQMPTPHMPQCLVTLCEGGDAWAEQELARFAATAELHAATGVYFPAFRHSGSRPMAVIGPAFRLRPEDTFRVAAALGSLGPDPYPEREDDLALVAQVLREDHWRRNYPGVWGVSSYVLGRSGDERGIAAIHAAIERVEDPTSRAGQLEAAALSNGLITAGILEPLAFVESLVYRPEPAGLLAHWFTDALLWCFLRTGNETARRSLRRMWEEQGPFLIEQRWRIARGLFLQESLPDPEAPWIPHMLADLEHPDAPPLSHALAASFRLRRGEQAGLDRLIEILRLSARDVASDDPRVDQQVAGARPFLEALRALWVYPPLGHGQD